MEELWGNLGQILAGFLAGLLAFVLTKLKSWWKHKLEYNPKNIVDRNNRIKDMLTEIRVFFDADRVKLFQVHNGDYFINGSSIQKLSLTHFVLGKGISVPYGVDSIYRNIPISYVVYCIEHCIKNPYLIADVKSLENDFYFKSLFRHNGEEKVMFCGVFDGKKSLLGILTVSWLESKDFIKNELAEITTFSEKISDELLFAKI